jgi:1,4-dihydroxy-2-naphthoyl-CoA synthase
VSSQHRVDPAAETADADAATELAERRSGRRGLITGTPGRVTEHLASLAERGMERFYLQFSDFGWPDTLERFDAQVIPAVGDAFARAEADDAVRVVILCGAGPLFSSGHDMGSREAVAERQPGPGRHPSYHGHGGTCLGLEGRMLQEWHYFFENARRWRNLRKNTIAQVQGTAYPAGLMQMWACDLIPAADGASFADVVGTRLGMRDVKYFAHL